MSWAWRQLSWLLMGSCISPLPGPRRGRGKGCDTLGAVTELWLGLEQEEARPGSPAHEELLLLLLASVSGEQGEAWLKHEHPSMV